ncbi:MAG: FprA family A-type flavoprotein [Ruminococcaceae bacterium]|nr:FprA family A-type flavoprotein [Oscillospiraceae bacterium]
MQISKDLIYVGVTDSGKDLFEGQYKVPCGITYNSYAIIDEKIAVMDTTDGEFCETWLANVEKALNGRDADYLIVQHMEPDHSSNIVGFAKRYPKATVVASEKAFVMMKNFYGSDYVDRRLVVKEGDKLSLGKHTLSFISAPMVHWPEVIMTYDECDKVLFSADGFGRFGNAAEDDDWKEEARRYYIGIVGKYGAQVSAVLKKAASLDIKIICPLHGPVLTKNLGYYIDLYTKWASYTPEEDGVAVAYASVYGNTRAAAEMIADRIGKGTKVKLFDLSRCDIHEAIAYAFAYPKLVLASTTYNADLFPPVKAFIDGLRERGYRNRKVGLIENGSWAPMAAKLMKASFESCKDISFADTTVKILSSLSDDSRAALEALALEMMN